MRNDKLAALQHWLNVMTNAGLVVDGLCGPSTRQAIFDAFANRNAPAITQHQLKALAVRLGGSVAQIMAVAEVESAGGGFLPTGHPKLLWERHYFWRRLRVVIPGLSNPKPGGYSNDANRNGINDSWERMAEGMMRSPHYAIESASWGKFQVMGAWWKKLGYRTPIDFAWAMRESEFDHYDVMARYIETFGLLEAFRSLSTRPDDCRAFARGYKGPAYERGRYHYKLASAMRRFA